MLKIRLRRMGSRHRPFYRVVVGDSRRTPAASTLEEIGYYDPRKKPATLKIDVARADHWVSQGARPSETVERLIAQAREAPEAPAEAEAVSAGAEATSAETEAEPEKEATAEASEPSTEAPAAEAPPAEAPAADAEAELEKRAAAEASEPSAPSAEADAKADADSEAAEKT